MVQMVALDYHNLHKTLQDYKNISRSQGYKKIFLIHQDSLACCWGTGTPTNKEGAKSCLYYNCLLLCNICMLLVCLLCGTELFKGWPRTS